MTPATVTIRPNVLYFGTPVVVLSTINPDLTTNLSPISSAWAIGQTYVLGLHVLSAAAANVRRHPDVVINLPGAAQWEAVERLAPLTAADPVPELKRHQYATCGDKFAATGLTAIASETGIAQRVAEMPVQIEGRVSLAQPDPSGDFVAAHVAVTRVHVHADLAVPGTDHVDLGRWDPLLYVFRHYRGKAVDLARNFRAEQ